MKGIFHLILSFLSLFLLSLPFLNTDYAFIFLFSGAIGSLLPDLDAPDALILHPQKIIKLQGKRLKLIRLFLIGFVRFITLFSKLLMYIYFVFLWLLGIKASLKHREYFHSVLAGIIVSFFNSAMILIVLKYFNFLNPVRILTLFFGFLSGFILHLLEDSTTVSGVALLFPFSDLKIHGNIHTSKDVFYCLTLTISLIFSIFLSFYLNLLFPANFILLLLVWFVFYRIASIRVASF